MANFPYVLTVTVTEQDRLAAALAPPGARHKTCTVAQAIQRTLEGQSFSFASCGMHTAILGTLTPADAIHKVYDLPHEVTLFILGEDSMVMRHRGEGGKLPFTFTMTEYPVERDLTETY